MSAHELLRKAGWRMRTIGGEPHWEHPTQPDVNYSTACAMEQALAWAQQDRDSIDKHSRCLIDALAAEREAHAKTRAKFESFILDMRELQVLRQEASAFTPAERAVLDAIKSFSDGIVHHWAAHSDGEPHWIALGEAVCEWRELARRGEKP